MWWSMVPCPISCKSFHVLLTWWSHFPKCLSFTLLQVASIITWSMVYDYMVELSCKFPFIWWWSKWLKHAVTFMLFHYIWMLVHVVISLFKHLCYVNGDLITFCQHLYFSFSFSLSCGTYYVDGVICYLHSAITNGDLITLCTQRSHTHIRSHLSLNKIKLGHLKSTQNEPNTLKDPPAGPKNT